VQVLITVQFYYPHILIFLYSHLTGESERVWISLPSIVSIEKVDYKLELFISWKNERALIVKKRYKS